MRKKEALFFMKASQDLLNRIHRNTQMGLETLPLLASKAEDTQFKNTLREQWKDYQALNTEAETLMRKRGIKIRGVNEMARMSAVTMTNMKTLMDRSTSKLAEMAIQGSNMGVTKITKALHETRTTEHEAIDLANRVLKVEMKNLAELREYL